MTRIGDATHWFALHTIPSKHVSLGHSMDGEPTDRFAKAPWTRRPERRTRVFMMN